MVKHVFLGGFNLFVFFTISGFLPHFFSPRYPPCVNISYAFILACYIQVFAVHFTYACAYLIPTLHIWLFVLFHSQRSSWTQFAPHTFKASCHSPDHTFFFWPCQFVKSVYITGVRLHHKLLPKWRVNKKKNCWGWNKYNEVLEYHRQAYSTCIVPLKLWYTVAGLCKQR